MSEPLIIDIDMDKRCTECGKGGAVHCGLCIKCCDKAAAGKPMKSPQGKALAATYAELKEKYSRGV